MKKLLFFIPFFLGILCVNAQNTFPTTGSAGIGTVSPNASAILDVVSTNKGVLIPRMTIAQRNLIAIPATGLMIYQTNSTPGFYFFNGIAWAQISTGKANSNLNNLSINTAINSSLLPATTGLIDLGSLNNNWRKGFFKGNVEVGSINDLRIGTGGGGITNNIAIGSDALTQNTVGDGNIAIGNYALGVNTFGQDNTAVGYLSLGQNDSGSNNTAIGLAALSSNKVGNYNTAVGSFALSQNSEGNYNTAVGKESLKLNTTGSGNTSFGVYSMYGNTLGKNNTAIGLQALFTNTIGIYNTANGANSLYYTTEGNYNTATGMNALFKNATGSSNTASGINALFNSIGYDNTAEGRDALYYATGNKNTALGRDALIGISNGDNNIGVGYSAQVPIAAGSNQIRIGNSNITYAGVQVAWSITSDKRWKTNIQNSNLGLAFIKQLNPVSYVRKNNKSNKTEYGFIAQELEAALKNAGAENSGIITISDSGMYSVRYNDLLAPIVKGMQELSKKNDELGMMNEELKKENANTKDDFQKQLKEQQKQIGDLKTMLQANAKTATAINQKDVSFETAKLEQNIPNPPAGNFTKINYNIPNGAAKAELVILDNAGRIIKTIGLNTFGKGVLNVDTKGLTAGTYNYTLYVDGKVIDTKKMVVAN